MPKRASSSISKQVADALKKLKEGDNDDDDSKNSLRLRDKDIANSLAGYRKLGDLPPRYLAFCVGNSIPQLPLQSSSEIGSIMGLGGEMVALLDSEMHSSTKLDSPFKKSQLLRYQASISEKITAAETVWKKRILDVLLVGSFHFH